MHHIHIDKGASVRWHKCIGGSKYAKSGKRSGKYAERGMKSAKRA